MNDWMNEWNGGIMRQGEAAVLGEVSVHRKFHVEWSGIESGTSQWEVGNEAKILSLLCPWAPLR